MAKALAKNQADSNADGRPVGVRRSARTAGKKEIDPPIKQDKPSIKTSAIPSRGKKRTRVKEEEPEDPEPLTKVTKKSASPPASVARSRSVKAESASPSKGDDDKKTRTSKDGGARDKEADLRAKKLKSYAQFANKSPYPDFARPTPEECERAYRVLASIHGERQRPEKVLAAPADRAGCGDAPSVLDALVRTILSQNTSARNSTRAKLDMDAAYGDSGAPASEARWEAVARGGAARLEKAIARGGLGGVKSRVIVGILEQVKERYGRYSLDHLLLRRQGSDEEDEEAAMRELISFKGVGPKTASCVLLFCVGRDSFAVDTHVHRLTGTLGWRPAGASRDGAFAHLDARVPDRLKYGLHVLLVEHGRGCEECRAGGRSRGRCELRRAFRGVGGRGEDDGGEGSEDGVKEEEEEENEETAVKRAVKAEV
ncbi:DNA glycosylase [Hypoxylon sp. FL1284]|nr:DNA glycosylase [Hypoxylon sp. FL1284]